MKNILKFPLILLCMLMVGSCSESLEELNIDPTNPTDVELKFLLPEILSSAAFNEGTNPNRVAGIITQQLFGIDAQQLAYNSYVLGEEVMNNYWLTGLYAGTLRSSQVIIDKSADEAAPRPYYGAIAKIIMANELGKATSFFGDIPFTEALQGTEVLKPVYDSQESVYGSVQSLLSEAISTLEGLTDGGGYNGGDLVFDGDAASWVKAAHGMKARYFMHTSKRTGNYADAVSEAQMAMASNGENPAFQFDVSVTANHSLAKFGIERPSTLGIHPNFAAMMDGDPRQAKYMYTDGTTWWYFDSADGGEMVWAQSNALIPYITYTEMLFIQAEAMARSGGDASDLLAQAVTSSFELVGLTADDATAYVAGLNSSIETIMTEAYKAYYGFNFHEVWSNWRRTGFPALTPAAGGSGGLNPSGAIPQRYLYAQSETQTNFDNVDAARARQGGGLLDAPVWAFE